MNWNIQIQPDGSCDVLKNNRGFVNGIESVSLALKKVRRSRFYSVSDTITVIDENGYRRKI